MKKTILHVIDNLGRGGAERVVVNNLNLFDEYNHVLCILNGPDDLKTELKKYIPIINLNFQHKLNVFQAIKSFRRICKDHEVDLIHAHLLWSSWVARMGKTNRIPLVTTIHNCLSIDAFKKNWWSKAIEQATAKKVNHFVGVSATVLQDYFSHIQYKGNSSFIYNYNNIGKIVPVSKDYLPGTELKIICVGNLREAKNYLFLIRALATLPEIYRASVRIDIYGTGHLEQVLKTESLKYGVPVNFLGAGFNIGQVYAQYDLFCMCSIIEGMPMALLEASVAGLPLLLSDISVFRELADKKALFFDLNNSGQFLDTLIAIINGEILLRGFSAASRRLSVNFDNINAYRDKHYSLYDSLIKANQADIPGTEVAYK